MRCIVFIIAALLSLAAAQRRPPNYSQDEMPDTSFDCRDKVVGGYYADIETDCQMFHVCVKVPGLGIQDYRFLCPNDTTFDQENQICANWYDIDCEASTLYYSDNFDLYRIDKGASPSSKGTPIPLGPSTQRPPVAPPKKRPLIQKQDDEEEFYLQRSETGDRRLQQGRDLLRGSSSGNFFNKNQGKEDDFDDNYQAKEAKPADVPRRRNQQNNNNKKKVAVRKLRKRPDAEIDVNAQQSYQANPTTSPPASTDYTRQTFANNQRFNSQNYDVPRVSPSSPKPVPTTEATTRNQPRYNTINRNTNTPTTTQAPTTFYQPNNNNNNFNNNNNNNFNNNVRANNRQAFEIQRATNNFAKSTTLNYDVPKVPTTKKFDNTPRGFEVQKTNVGRGSASGISSTTVSYQTTNYQQQNSNNNFARSSTFNAAPTTFAPVTYSGNFRQNAFAKSSTADAQTQREYQDYNGNYDSYGNQRSNNNQQQQQQNGNNASPQTSDEYVERDSEKEFLKTAPSNNIRPSNFNTFNKNYNNYNANNYTSTTDNNNNNQAQNFYNNQKSTATFNYDKTTKNDFNTKTTAFYNNNNNNNNNFRSQSTPFVAANPTTKRPSTQYYQPSTTQYYQSPSSVQPSSTTYAPPKTSAVRNSGGGAFYQQPSSFNPSPPSSTTLAPSRGAPQRNSGVGNFYQQPASFNPAPAPSPSAPPKKSQRPPTEPKKSTPIKDASYDYAYYDDTDATEYEGTDPISDHHFGKAGDSLKIRS